MRRHLSFSIAAAFLALTGCAANSSADQTQSGAVPQNQVGGVLLVANQQAASASIVDLATGSSREIDVGVGPHETAISHDGRTGVVTIYGQQPAGNELALIDLKSGAVTKRISLGQYTRPHGAAFLPGDTQIVATSESTRNIVIVDIASGKVTAIPTNARGSHMLALKGDGSTLFTANMQDGSISEIDLAKKAFVATYPIGTQTEGIGMSLDGRYVWVGSNNGGTASVFDTQTKSIVATIPGVGMPYRLGVSPDGRTAVIADPPNDQIRIADARTHKVVAVIPMAGGPQGIAFSPDSRTAFITMHGTSEAAQVDLVAHREVRRWRVGAGPDGIAYTPVVR